jgi:ribose transport system substrate-binding protein
MKISLKHIVKLALMLLGLTIGFRSASASEFDDGLVLKYLDAFKGKKVAFVPISMGFDMPQAWMAVVQHDAKRLGYELVIRDPNWNMDAGAQALEQLIAEKPDIIIVQNYDTQAYSKLVQRAMAQGIPVIQMNLKTMNNGDAYVGGDWYRVAFDQTVEAARMCGPGTSGKIALLHEAPTSPQTQIGVAGVMDAVAQHKNLTVVAKQSADADASKAHAVTTTILKQNPDLCAIVGFWDNQDVGAAAAIREAGLTGKVKLITEGAGNQDPACKNIENGGFDSYIKVDASQQGLQLAEVIQTILQTKTKAGSAPFGVYTENVPLTRETLKPNSCWTLDQLKAGN